MNAEDKLILAKVSELSGHAEKLGVELRGRLDAAEEKVKQLVNFDESITKNGFSQRHEPGARGRISRRWSASAS